MLFLFLASNNSKAEIIKRTHGEMKKEKSCQTWLFKQHGLSRP